MTSHDTEGLQRVADQLVELVRAEDARTDATVEANVRVSRTRHGLTRFANSAIHQHVGEDTRTVQLTVAVDGRTASASTTDLGDTALRSLVATTVASAALQPVDPLWPGATPPAGLELPGHLDDATAAADPALRAELVRTFVDQAPDLSAAGYLDTEAVWAAFASTAGQRVAGATSRATLDGIHQTATSAGTAHQTSVRIGDLDAAAAGELATDRARRSATFEDLDPGTFEVVLGPEAVSTVLSFLALNGLNAKRHLEGASFVKLGTRQLDGSVTIVDDPGDPRAIGLPFDAEGTPRSVQVLVEDGVPRTLVHDRRTAEQAGAVSTGGAIPGGDEVGAFPTNLVLVDGSTPPEKMVADIERGLVITQFHYVRDLDPKSLVCTGLTRNGTFLIEDGEVVGAVGNLRFTQSFVDALAPGQVLAVGDDGRYAMSEFGAGLTICPSLRLAGWSFTGNARG